MLYRLNQLLSGSVSPERKPWEGLAALQELGLAASGSTPSVSGQYTFQWTVFTLHEALGGQLLSSDQGTPCPWPSLSWKRQEDDFGELGQP